MKGNFVSIGISCALLAPPAAAQDLRIYFIDVEQASATLFVSPGGHTLLVDTGKDGHGGRLREALQAAQVSRIEHLVITHYHEDHYGGSDELTENPAVPVDHVYDRGDKDFLPPGKKSEGNFTRYEAALGHRAEHITRGETIPLDPLMAVTCVASGGVVLGEDPPEHGTDENDMSVALLVTFGGFQCFVGGDIEHPTETKIAGRDLVLDVDVYVADHHGAENGSFEAFMKDLKPAAIIVSNGSHGTYRHPRQATLDLYGNLNPAPAVFQTNKCFTGGVCGNVAEDFIADLEPGQTDGTILATVQGAAFTITCRDRSHAFPVNGGVAGAGLVIERLLPNPEGHDSQLETVTLRNRSAAPVSMAGWTLEDDGGKVWALVGLGTIGAGQSAVIQRNGMPMSLDNDGDTIRLFGPGHSVVDSFHLG